MRGCCKESATRFETDHQTSHSIAAYKRQFAVWEWQKNSSSKGLKSLDERPKKRQKQSHHDAIFDSGVRQSAEGEVDEAATGLPPDVTLLSHTYLIGSPAPDPEISSSRVDDADLRVIEVNQIAVDSVDNQATAEVVNSSKISAGK